MTKSSTLDRVWKGDLCAGCGLCRAVVAPGKIEMAVSPGGYLRPDLQESLTAEEDRMVADVCPGLRISGHHAGTTPDPLWGPFVKVREGHATDPVLRHHASSGGALSAFLKYLLDNEIVDYVLENTGSESFPVQNEIIESRNGDDVYRAAGSRYAPSAPLSELARQLDGPERFAFVGKPCDVAALRALARVDKRVDETIPYMFSFFCAGIPSLSGAREILKKLSVDEKDVVAFRYRGDGWPGTAMARLRDGREEHMSYIDSWGAILSYHVQFRCKICPDGVGEAADLVCADAWNCDERGYPLFEEEDGRSLIITRNAKGEALFQEALSAGYVTAADSDLDAVFRMQPGQVRRKQRVFSRLCAVWLFGRVMPRFEGCRLLASAAMINPWQNIRDFLGTARRLMRLRLSRITGRVRKPAANKPG